ncbi:TetR/AcrR family transcriptional regulator [Alysiella filiformis]|uniref:Transcriptional regulator, TetR family n=1 Tax=Alysiella filiformis DSM 16848 TaxID=1120981 RepID=A0A286ES01_9NEIS|nr:TetR/AcrR family transcriptional regulator [Alysiella filiformis]QMT31977.1 TetR/AcrR family transcriptional regulator [Alysiella filiformis]UBQ57115.1 TetR/AcrR family transcriptional regulator [Alysiella filiformis DSM 16848]SOD73705.1 transcriptional regulator, TetR family [Alysiella filiformis DSM 16848]
MNASKNSTYQRIIDASLKLFNENGERATSTNHIAAHLSISPGNLYYHFANKDEIIMQLFKRYSGAMLDYLSNTPLPENVVGCVDYMNGVLAIMWDYRFLFSDVNTLLNRSAAFLGEHNEFTHVQIAPLLVKLLTKLQESQLIQIDEIGKQDLAINMWMITKYWFDFDNSMNKGQFDENSKSRGIYRTLSLLRPYLLQAHIGEFDALLGKIEADNRV